MPMWWKRPRVWFFVLLIFAVSAAATLSWFLTAEGRAHADQWSSIIFGGTAAVAVLVTALRWLWLQDSDQAGTVTPERLTTAQAVLARAQIEQWTAEEVARQIQDPWPLRVRWQVTRRARQLMVSWAAVRGTPDADEIPLEGTYDRVADVFDHPDSPGRLVVLGEPGAGKSMLVLRLTLQLLQRRGEHDPVPVLLPVAGWDPAQPLDEWVAAPAGHRSSAAGHAGGGAGRGSPDAGPRAGGARDDPAILDGLDEISPIHHSRALAAITAAAGSGARFVLTSRTKAYERAVHVSSPLARTPVVELQPMTPDDAARYLVDGTDHPLPRWSPVLAQLAAGGGTPLAQTLSTPLMIWLARVVYQHRDSDPGELLTARWATTRAGIEKHLLQQLIPAAYTAAVGGHPGRTSAGARTARRTLTTLARHLRADRTYDLTWWRLNEISPGPAGQLTTVLLSATALLVALVVAVAGVASAEDVAELHRHSGWLRTGLAVGPALGVAVGLARRLFDGQWYPRRVSFAQLPMSLLVIGCPVALLGASMEAPAAGVVAGLAAGTALTLVAGGTPAGGDTQRGLSPAALLIEDRNSAVVGAATSVFAIATAAFAPGVPTGMSLDAIAYSAAVLGLLPVATLVLGAWGHFCVARLVLFACRRMPLRLMSSLAEAHDRGVLRQAGGVYQFRHNLLQDHLAAPAPTGSAARAEP
ncbi:hypothetical protein GCM10020358_37670 [Amorphoplanes nipponensis]|uniref:hypothetical protein n=1 Tax=Actinoplanes nipponensis TaxID=135950 RepID=UPI0031E6BB93